MKRLLALCVVLVLMATVFAGCSGDKSSGTGKAGGEKTIVFWHHIQEEELQSWVESFAKEYPNIKIDATFYGDPAITDALNVAAASGTGPDMFFEWNGTQLTTLIDNDFVAVLDEYAKQYKWEEKYTEAALGFCRYKGKYYAAPRAPFAMGLFYNKETFKKAGITKVPETFAELEAACEALKAQGITPFSLGGKYGWNTMRVTDGVFEQICGSELHDKLKSLEASWDCPEVVATYEKLKEWSVKGYFPEGFLGVDPSEVKFPWYQGDAAMVMEGGWMEAGINEDGQNPDNFAFFPFPSDANTPKRYIGFAEVYGVAAHSKVKDECILFIEHFLSKEFQEAHQIQSGRISPRKDIVLDAEKYPLVAQIHDLLLNNPLYGCTDTVLPWELVQTYFEVQDQVIGLELEPEAAAKKMQKAVEDWKAKQD